MPNETLIERNKEIVRLWEAGEKMAEIGAQFGISKASVSAIIAKAGSCKRRPRRGRPPSCDPVAEALIGKLPGETYADVAKRTGIPEGTLFFKVWSYKNGTAPCLSNRAERLAEQRALTRQKWLRIAQEAAHG